MTFPRNASNNLFIEEILSHGGLNPIVEAGHFQDVISRLNLEHVVGNAVDEAIHQYMMNKLIATRDKLLNNGLRRLEKLYEERKNQIDSETT